MHVGGIIDREPKGYCPSRRSHALGLMRRVFPMDPLVSSRASKGRFAAIVTVLLAVMFLVGVSFLPVSKEASAAVLPKNVRGHIYDEFGNPIGGANVTVEIVRGGITMDTLWYDSSEADGLYTVTFGMGDDMQVGDTIEVTATYSGHSSSNSAIAADDTPLQTIDVYIIGVFIPEFGSLSVVLVCGAFVAFVILIRMRRNSL
jgi:hypothetical protein